MGDRTDEFPTCLQDPEYLPHHVFQVGNMLQKVIGVYVVDRIIFEKAKPQVDVSHDVNCGGVVAVDGNRIREQLLRAAPQFYYHFLGGREILQLGKLVNVHLFRPMASGRGKVRPRDPGQQLSWRPVVGITRIHGPVRYDVDRDGYVIGETAPLFVYCGKEPQFIPRGIE